MPSSDSSNTFNDKLLDLHEYSRELIDELIKGEKVSNLIYSEGPAVIKSSTKIEKCFHKFTSAFEKMFCLEEFTIYEDALDYSRAPILEIEYLGFQEFSSNGNTITNVNMKIARVGYTYQIHPDKVRVFAHYEDLLKEKAFITKLRVQGKRDPSLMLRRALKRRETMSA